MTEAGGAHTGAQGATGGGSNVVSVEEYRALLEAEAKRKHKYGAVPLTVDGHYFDSTAEAARYGELLLLEREGEIADIAVHPTFRLEVNGILICTYEGDFRYRVIETGAVVTEDVKGHRTESYKLKRQLMRAVLGITITEVRA